jgi:hypothetical protein
VTRGASQLVRPRLGQGTFRIAVTSAYGAGYVTVTPDHRFRVSRDVFAEFHNGREYERFAGRTITVPHALTDQFDPELLDWHAAEVFRR